MLGSFVALLAFFTPFRRLNWKTTLKFDPQKVLLWWTKNRETLVRACFRHSAYPPKMAFLWKIPNYPFQPYLQNTSFFPAKLPVFASIFFNRRCSFDLCFGQRWQVGKQGVISAFPWRGNIEIATPCLCLTQSQLQFSCLSYPTAMPSHTWCFIDVAAPRWRAKKNYP